jgi:hypothetical protein
VPDWQTKPLPGPSRGQLRETLHQIRAGPRVPRPARVPFACRRRSETARRVNRVRDESHKQSFVVHDAFDGVAHARTASHTRRASCSPKRFAMSCSRRSVTYVRCADVLPLSPLPMRSRSNTATRFPAFLRTYAAVNPVMPHRRSRRRSSWRAAPLHTTAHRQRAIVIHRS